MMRRAMMEGKSAACPVLFIKMKIITEETAPA